MNEVISIFLMIIMYILVLVYVIKKIKMSKKLLSFFVTAIFMRIILSIINLYVFPDILPHSGADSKGFEEVGYYLSTGAIDISTYSWDNYPKLIASVYFIIGRKPLVIIAINGVLSMLSAIKLSLILDMFIESRKKFFSLLNLFLFFPHNIIFSSVILRESIILFLVIQSLYVFFKYTKNKKISTIFSSFIYILLAAPLHAGVIFVSIGYLFYILNDKEVIRKYDKLKKPLIIILIVFIIGSLSFSGSGFFRKFSSFDSLDSIYQKTNRISDNSGGSAYLSTLRIDNFFEMLVFLPIKIVYLLFSPMPWDIRNLNDIVAFFLDSMIYIYLTMKIVKKIRDTDFKNEKNRLFISLLIGLIITLSAFALGTSNAGTALRHRFKILPLMIILSAFPILLKSTKMRRKRSIKE